MGHLTRKVHELQSQVKAAQAKVQSNDKDIVLDNEEEEDLLDVSLAVAATGE